MQKYPSHISGFILYNSIVADASKIEVEFKSDVNTDTAGLPNFDMVEEYGNELLDMQVGQTDMKVRHIFKKFVEVYFCNLSGGFSLVKNLKHVWNTDCVLCFFRQQTTTWKSMAPISLTFRTSEYLICLRFPCQRRYSWIRKFEQKIIHKRTFSNLMTLKLNVEGHHIKVNFYVNTKHLLKSLLFKYYI